MNMNFIQYGVILFFYQKKSTGGFYLEWAVSRYILGTGSKSD